MKALTVYNWGKKVRYGKEYDGGYILADGLQYDLFLSGGIGNDLSFERDFMAHHNNIAGHVFDNSSTYRDDEIKNLTYHDTGISGENTDEFTNLSEYLSIHKNVFVKMDIEGWERKWLDTLVLQNNIKQLVIEFHGLEISLPYIEKLNKTHALIHLHGNNCGGLTQYKGRLLPNVIECTYLRKDCFIKLSLNNRKLPCELDMPNTPDANDYSLKFKPFVNL